MAGIPISVIKNAIEQEKWQKIRQKRDQLLSSSDWTQVADYPLSEAQKNAWSVYRQALRDIPEKFEVSDSIVWPEVPNA
ncbi:phage tail assembly chaperone [Pseudoalteromonas luteoviolacea]|nr:phage tail assembly chaperone [Pseudoalteromonas luteoviolacea]